MTANLISDPRSQELREYGVELVSLERSKAFAAITDAVALYALLFLFGGFLVIVWFGLSSLGVLATQITACALAVVARWPVCSEQWPIFRRCGQELRLLHSVVPLVVAYRRGRQISKADRALVYLARESILSLAARLRGEADEWRKLGREKRGAALASLVYELEDAQKLLGERLAKEEKEIRPAPPPPQLLIEPAPIAQVKTWSTTGLERSHKRMIKAR